MTRGRYDERDAVTLWVCVDCALADAGYDDHLDEDGAAHDGNVPWSKWDDCAHITSGLLAREHECGYVDEVTGQEYWQECSCEHDEFSWRECDGCGSRLGGSRDAFTYWPPRGWSDAERDAMLSAYVECALWSSSDEHGTPLDEFELGAGEREALAVDLFAFISDPDVARDLEGMDPEQVGHDFWLTRNGHGAGFWDRGLGERGDRLTAAAHVYGEVDLYVGDDGLVWS